LAEILLAEEVATKPCELQIRLCSVANHSCDVVYRSMIESVLSEAHGLYQPIEEI